MQPAKTMEKLDVNKNDCLMLGGKMDGYEVRIFDRAGKLSGEMKMDSYESILFVRRGSKTQEAIHNAYATQPKCATGASMSSTSTLIPTT